ncbi:hypothetical protein [Streptosporangium canum]|uniref:hypothetical protein n=1 Tax=Streptosporangium canum TaxID=324952 RepID=UPI0037941169
MNDQPSVDVALAKLQSTADVGFARLDGKVDLINQRLDQGDARHAALERRVEQHHADTATREDALEKRLDAVERDAVTRPQLADRTRQIIAVVGLMVTVAGVIIALLSLTRS